MTASIIFPHQLYKQHPALLKGVPVFLVEEWLFFNQYHFHKQKLVLHRASMKCYQEWLEQQGFSVTYIEATAEISDVRKLLPFLATQNVSGVRVCDTTDDWLHRRINAACKKNGIDLVRFISPNFLNKMDEVSSWFDKQKTYFQTDFYISQRKARNILLEGNNQPLSGKWTFDSDNRERFPKKEMPPLIEYPGPNKYADEAKGYVEKNWPHNYGSLDDFRYPVSFAESEKWLQQFLENRFEKFGIYEDAMVADESILYHSQLTPMLNIGLLSPQQVLEAALAHASEHDIPLNSLEGFARQVMGWREFIRIVYEREGRKQRTTDYWNFKRIIPHSFWKGETGIVPVDMVIKKTLKYGYNHHIERLMVLGNFMILCEFDPNDVYRWFMEMFIDAYDWVMVPNVYGMTQFADGGLMVTKPYISGSNYLMKMGDWPKGAWQEIWDGLFWRFMHVHRNFFETNPRLGMLIKTFDKMDAGKKAKHLANAEAFLEKLDRGD